MDLNTSNPRKIIFFVAALFFISGGCGLIYEVLWTRYLADLMGGTSLSQLVVLMVFMGGLALGAMLIGRLVDRGRNGLVYYGWLEVGLGLYAVLFPFLFSKVSGIFVLVGSYFAPGSSALLALKLLTASLLIAGPSVAMGGTLPAVTRYLTSSQEGLRRNIALLYAINSLGAVVGILAGGFFLVYRYGLAGSMTYTGVINICLGTVALGLARFLARGKAVAAGAGVSDHLLPEEVLESRIYSPYAVRRAVVAAGLSGFAAMALQIAWIRYFVIVLGGTHSVFTIVVAAFIFGIGLGAFLVRSRWIGRFPLTTVLTCAFALTTTTIGIGLFGYGRLPFEISRFLATIDHIPSAWPLYVFLKFGICFALMSLPAVASGMILPLCVRIAARSGDRVGRDVAAVYAVNTLGALLGIGITSQILFRMLTLPRTLQFILMIYLAATIFLAFVLEEKGRKRILVFSTCLLSLHLLLWQPWSPLLLHVRRVEFGQDQSFNYADFVKTINMLNVLVEERHGPDVQATVVDVFPTNQDSFRSMFINGKPDASNKKSTDLATEILLGHLPMLLHPAPRNAFVLGLGSGITSGEILKFPGVKKVVTAELAAEVFAASKAFAADNGRFWENPKHRMVIDDGKTFLRLSREKFDVIAMEPTNVWQEGMAGLFSEDFFRLVRSRLAPGGVVCQWLHIYQLDDTSLNIILKTFSQVFPASSIFEVWRGDILLVGYDDQWQFNPQNLEQRFYQPQILKSQNIVGNVNPSALLLREIMGRDNFKKYTTEVKAPINTENLPVLEKAAEYSLFIQESASILMSNDSRINPDGKDLLIHDYFKQVGFDPAQLKAVVDLMEPGKNDQLRDSLKFMVMSELWAGVRQPSLQELFQYFDDPQLREIITNPYYRLAPDKMTADEALTMLSGEVLLWNKAASQIWTPRTERLLQLYYRVAFGIDREAAARLALDVVVSLAEASACNAALPFLQILEAEEMALKRMEPIDIISLFFCEAKVGDAQKANDWWELIEQNKIPQTELLQAEKAALDIKLAGPQPPPVNGEGCPR